MEFDKKYWQTIGPLGFPQQDRQARQLDALLRSLPQSGEYAYKHAMIQRAPTEVNPGERSDVSWITTESVDRSGEIVMARGMNASQFCLNPLVTLQHNYQMPPVGRSLWQKRVRDGELAGIKAKTQYPPAPTGWPADDPWPSDRVFSLIQSGLLSGKSIGFLPTRVHFADSKEATKNNWPVGATIFDEWLLLEYSCVFLPANQDALVLEVSKGHPVDPWILQQLDLPCPPAVSSSPGISFVSMREIERAVEKSLQAIDWERCIQQQTESVLDRARGRV